MKSLDRQTDRQRERERDRETDRQTDRERESVCVRERKKAMDRDQRYIALRQKECMKLSRQQLRIHIIRLPLFPFRCRPWIASTGYTHVWI